ncbi:MAG: hypothetical protein IPH04_14435 [Saprospirales bacterium]|nr:hypothetical protein [Saprospirales bacterium]
MEDPKQKRVEGYKYLRDQGYISFNDEEMEELMNEPENRVAFHKFLTEKKETGLDYNSWESKFYSDKKKVSGEPLADTPEPSEAGSLSTTEPTVAEVEPLPSDATPRDILAAQGVTFEDKPEQAPNLPATPSQEPQEMTSPESEPISLVDESLTPAPLQSAPIDTKVYGAMLENRKAKQDQLFATLNAAAPADIENPETGYALLSPSPDSKKLHSDPNTSDWTKGVLKVKAFEDAQVLVQDRMGLIETALPAEILDRYSTIKSSLIEITEAGTPIEESPAAIQLIEEYDQLIADNPALAEYDQLNAKAYSISKGYENIREVNPTYFDDQDKRRMLQDYADFKDKEKPRVLASVQSMGKAAGQEVVSTIQGMLGSIAAFGNITGDSATRYDWADKLAEWSSRNLDPGLMTPGAGGQAMGLSSKYQRSLYTNTARVGDFQIDIDRQGQPSAVRDSDGYLVQDDEIRQQVLDQYEAAPDKYDVRMRPHLAPALTTAAGGAMQVVITSRFAGLGRTAAAAKGYAAGQLTSRFAGQTYLQSIEEFGPENADVASRFALATATLQSAVAMYINPLEMKLAPQTFAVSGATLRKISSDLGRGLSKDAVVRNGIRAYADDLARNAKAWALDVGKESVEGLFETAIDVGGRMIVRSNTDIRNEYDASLGAFIEGMVTEGVGSAFAAGMAINRNNALQQQQLLVAYENKDRFLPMISRDHGDEVKAQVEATFAAADKRIAGTKTTREQKNAILVEEYNKATGNAENIEVSPTAAQEAPVQPTVEQAPSASKEVIPAPSLHEIVREEARQSRLDEGTTFESNDGVTYTVVSKDIQQGQAEVVEVRNQDTGEVKQLPAAQVRADLSLKYNDIIAREHPTTSPVRLAALRKGMAIAVDAEGNQLTLPAPDQKGQVAAEVAPASTQPAAPKTRGRKPKPPIPTQAPEQGAAIVDGEGDTYTIGRINEENVTLQDEQGETVNMSRAEFDEKSRYFEESEPAAPPPAPTAPSESNDMAPLASAQVPTFTLATIDQAEGIDTEGVKSLLQAVNEIAPGMEVQVFETRADLVEAMGMDGQSFVSDDGKTMFISKESTLADITHEVIHPILVAAEMRKPGTIDAFFNEVMSSMPPKIRQDMEKVMLSYQTQSEAVRKEEVVVEFMTRIATGTYTMKSFGSYPPLDKLLTFFQTIFSKLGLTNPPDSLKSLRSFAEKVVPALKKGQAITFHPTQTEGDAPYDTAYSKAAAQDMEFRTEQDWLDFVSRESNSAQEIEEAYRASRKADSGGAEISYKDQVIRDSKLFVMSREDFNRFGDANLLNGDAASRMKFVSTNAKYKALDDRVESVSAEAGVEITTDDVIDYVRRDMAGQIDKRKPGAMSDTSRALADRYKEVTGKAINKKGPGIKARITQDNVDVNYYRAKAWMKESWGSASRATMEADAVATFGISAAQANIMYEVLSKSPDVVKYSPPPGIASARRGVGLILDKASQWRDEYLLASQGLPKETMIAIEAAHGEADRLVKTVMRSYRRLQGLLGKLPASDKQRFTDIGNKFLSGDATAAEIASIPDPKIYAELVFMRSAIDEVSTEILNESAFSPIREEIASQNMGEYLSRAFRIHLSHKYTPSQAAKVAFMAEYRRKNADRLATENPTMTPAQLDEHIDNNARREMNTLLEKHKSGKGGKAQTSSTKPTGIMKEKKSFPGSAGKFVDYLDGTSGFLPLPPAGAGPLPYTGPYPPEFVDLYNAAYNAMRNERLRETFYTHPELKKAYDKAVNEGRKLMALAGAHGAMAPGGNPFTADSIRKAIEDRAPLFWTPPTGVPAAVATAMQAHVDAINDIIVDVSNQVSDRVQADMDIIVTGGNYIGETRGWREMEHILPGTRALLGEVPPLEAVVITMSKMASYYTLTKYYKALQAIGEGVFLFKADDQFAPDWATTKIGTPGSERVSPLDGMLTSPEIAAVLTNTEGMFGDSLPLAVQEMMKLNGWIQYGKTILSPATQAKNFLSNLWFVLRNWWSNPVAMTMGFAVIPADLLIRRLSGGKIRLTGNETILRNMADALIGAYHDNFGKGYGRGDVLDMAKLGFTDAGVFQATQRWMKPKVNNPAFRRDQVIADAQTMFGISDVQAANLYSALAPSQFEDYMGELINKLGGAGLIGSSVSLRTIYDNIRRVNTAEKAAAYVTNALMTEDTSLVARAKAAAAKPFQWIGARAEAAYAASDDTFKIFGYLQERSKYAKALFGKKYHQLSTDQQREVDAKAIEITKNIIPNYNRLGKAAKADILIAFYR